MSAKHKEYKGKDIDEAIAAACKDLKVSREELNIEVVSTGSAGIFGLCKKKAVVLVSRKVASAAIAESNPRDESLSAARPKSQPRSTNTDQAREKQTSRRDAVAAPKPDDAPLKAPSPEVLDEIRDLTQTFLGLMGFSLAVSMSTKGSKVTAHICSDNDSSEIIGRDGSVLDAIQYLLRKIISQKYPDKIILALDAGNYREDRRKELEELALEMATKVKETGKSQVMSALNPAERRIVHVILQDDTGIRSSSIGEGLFKKVRIYLPGKGRKRNTGRARGRALEPEELPTP
jgi:spoIIIJ-associated protein